ncbi:MAG: YheU family protein [Alteromonadaceae bacterium]|nr:YheU family protein [Alteromonadaceae bacterium]
MIIPVNELSPDILHSIIQEFVLREGTEYGLEDIALSEKIAQVKNQLAQGVAVIVFSELHQTVNIMPAEQFNQAQFTE